MELAKRQRKDRGRVEQKKSKRRGKGRVKRE